VSCPLRSTTVEQLTRRKFVARCAAAAASGAALCATPVIAIPARRTQSANITPATYRAPVVSFHIDRPYLDITGMATPYLPPAGTRSGQFIAELSDEEYLRRHAYS
jgi:hypothetical protein